MATSHHDVGLIDLDRLEARLDTMRTAYREAQPFPHIVIDHFLTEAGADAAMAGFPAVDTANWNNYIHVNERKYSNTDVATWTPTLRALLDVLHGPRFVAFLEELTGIEGLQVDPTLEGGGLHQSGTGGFLNIHADFTVHPRRRTWRRRVNLLLYLNPHWDPAYGGELELWSRDMAAREKSVEPFGNRAVVFTTEADSFHGHPQPLRCPPETSRRSLALYYFTEESNPVVRSTEYRSRPGEGPRRLLIFADKQAVRAFDWAKRRLGVSDGAVSRLFRRVEQLRSRLRRP